MFKREYFVLVLVLTTLLAFPYISNAESGGASSGFNAGNPLGKITPGKPAPKFELPDTKGNTIKLSDYKGKYVVLEWFNHGCPFVRKHYDSGNMQKLQKAYTGKGVIWLSICSSAPGKQGNCSASEHNTMFAEKHAAPTAVLMDVDGKVGHLYGATSTPDMFIIDPKGILIYAGAIDDTPGTDITEISTAKNYVKQALDESMAGKPITTAHTRPYGCFVHY